MWTLVDDISTAFSVSSVGVYILSFGLTVQQTYGITLCVCVECVCVRGVCGCVCYLPYLRND